MCKFVAIFIISVQVFYTFGCILELIHLLQLWDFHPFFDKWSIIYVLLLMLYIILLLHRFATLATRMEQYIQGQSRDLVDQAYTKFVSGLSLIICPCYCYEWYSIFNNVMNRVTSQLDYGRKTCFLSALQPVKAFLIAFWYPKH